MALWECVNIHDIVLVFVDLGTIPRGKGAEQTNFYQHTLSLSKILHTVFEEFQHSHFDLLFIWLIFTD